MTNRPEYKAWCDMLGRCNNQRHHAYAHYGQRGIRVCARWATSFAAFYADMGDRPPGMTLDRVDNDKDYGPGNCRWATRREQTRNRRTTLFEQHEPAQIRWLHSLGYRVGDIARFFGVSHNAIMSIVHRGAWAD